MKVVLVRVGKSILDIEPPNCEGAWEIRKNAFRIARLGLFITVLVYVFQFTVENSFRLGISDLMTNLICLNHLIALLIKLTVISTMFLLCMLLLFTLVYVVCIGIAFSSDKDGELHFIEGFLFAAATILSGVLGLIIQELENNMSYSDAFGLGFDLIEKGIKLKSKS